MSESASRGLVWFRRDLRLGDNPAWAAATSENDEVVAVFILEPALLGPASPRRRDQLFAHLRALDESLAERGGRLHVREGPAATVLPALIADAQASTVYLNRDVSQFSIRRDEAVSRAVEADLRGFAGLLVHEPGAVVTAKGVVSRVFSPFHEKWRLTPLTAWPVGGDARIVAMAGEDDLRRSATISTQHDGGEAGAWLRLRSWLERVDDYEDTRDIPAIEGTSQLSVDLKFGTVSPRTVLDVVGDSSPGRRAFVRQLAWRDWWAHLLLANPHLTERAMRPEYDAIAWNEDPIRFDAWARGATGYPIVDAGMRQLVATGWIHNRVRMITASFLVKDLLIDWRRGERFFRHHLVDGDVAQNVGNWQWAAGTGPDAAPYFRVLNPTLQSKKFDPSGTYIRRWVPELSRLEAPHVHNPVNAPPLELAAARVVLGDTYPDPVVDHQPATLETLDAYRLVRGKR